MEIIEGNYASDFTKKTLEQFGWAAGDPIPADLGDYMLKVKETLPTGGRTDVLIEREKMTDEQVAAVKDMLKKANEIAAARKRKEELDKKTSNMTDSVAEAYKQFVTDSPQIIDDREEAAAQAPPAENKTTDTPQPSTPENAPVASVPEATPAAFCPRCGWDMRLKFDVTPTERDKEDFLATLLGGTRFRKKYEIFGGRVVVTFRSVLAEENKLIYRQLVYDQKNGVVTSEAEWFVQLMDYRLACALESIADKNGKIVASIPELDQEKTTKDSTPLVDQLNMVNKDVLAQEATRRIVVTHLRQFQRLTEAIEAMALEPSFWTGIE